MNEQYVRNVIEAALLAAGRPLASDELVTLFDERDGSNTVEVTAAIEGLRSEYETRGLELVEVASGYRIQIRHAVAQPVSRLWQERPTKYSRALLETLALVAYRQPITRGEIEQIRGVAVNPNIIKTLLERSWIRVVGHRDVPGKPELLGTTRDFLDYFSLQKLDDLPTLAQLKELEDLRIQLNLPGAEQVVMNADIESAQRAEGTADAVAATGDAGAAHAEAADTEATYDGVGDAGAADAGASHAAPAAALALPETDESDADIAADDASGKSESAAAQHAQVDASNDDDEMDAGASNQHRPHGLVARGAEDDQD
jgi:segregation and condensation protein B